MKKICVLFVTIKIVDSEYQADIKVYIKENKYKSEFMDKYVN